MFFPPNLFEHLAAPKHVNCVFNFLIAVDTELNVLNHIIPGVLISVNFRNMMKGSLYGLRARELAMVTIVLMCITFLIWAWEKTPLLTAFLPPQTHLQLTPDIIVSKPVAGVVFSESQIIVGKDVSSFPEKLTENDEELNLDLADPENSVRSSPTRQEINSDLPTTTDQNGEIRTNVSEGEEEAKDKQIQEAEKKGGVEGPTSPTEVEGKHLKMVDQNSKQVGPILDMVTRTGSPSSSSVVGGKDDRNLTILKENQACNYAKGKWVPDNNRPLYSGFDCKQWLSGMWACRLTQRTDFAYEKLRWQPKYCQMEEFEGSKFLRKYVITFYLKFELK
nr:protein trichome birefringence-like 16 [Quercus suber]